MTLYCKQCGSPLIAATKFCRQCGGITGHQPPPTASADEDSSTRILPATGNEAAATRIMPVAEEGLESIRIASSTEIDDAPHAQQSFSRPTRIASSKQTSPDANQSDVPATRLHSTPMQEPEVEPLLSSKPVKIGRKWMAAGGFLIAASIVAMVGIRFIPHSTSGELVTAGQAPISDLQTQVDSSSTPPPQTVDITSSSQVAQDQSLPPDTSSPADPKLTRTDKGARGDEKQTSSDPAAHQGANMQPPAQASSGAEKPQVDVESSQVESSLTVEQRLRQGNSYLGQGLYQEALREYQEVRRLDPQNRDVYYLIAQAYHLSGQLSQALQAYRQCTSGNYAPLARQHVRTLEKKLGQSQ